MLTCPWSRRLADAGLAPEAYQNNPRVGLIAGSGGGSPKFQVFGADAMRSPRGLKAVGPYVVTKAMGFRRIRLPRHAVQNPRRQLLHQLRLRHFRTTASVTR